MNNYGVSNKSNKVRKLHDNWKKRLRGIDCDSCHCASEDKIEIVNFSRVCTIYGLGLIILIFARRSWNLHVSNELPHSGHKMTGQ